jgi:hypothetical protein
MLETPGIPHYRRAVRWTVHSGDNVTGADNQQERLAELRGWVIGFVDGEGCFSISFLRSDRKNKIGDGTGIQVFHEFVVVQGARSVGALHELQEHFGVGQVIANRRHDDHREDLYRYVVRRREDLLGTVIPFFEQYPLRTAKRLDFVKFAQCVELVAGGRHRTREGLLEIVRIVETMNRRKPRPELVRILRDHTPDIRDNG